MDHLSITLCRSWLWLKFETSKLVYKNALFFLLLISVTDLCQHILSRISHCYRFSIQHILRSMNHYNNGIIILWMFFRGECWILISDTTNVHQFKIEQQADRAYTQNDNDNISIDMGWRCDMGDSVQYSIGKEFRFGSLIDRILLQRKRAETDITVVVKLQASLLLPYCRFQFYEFYSRWKKIRPLLLLYLSVSLHGNELENNFPSAKLLEFLGYQIQITKLNAKLFHIKLTNTNRSEEKKKWKERAQNMCAAFSMLIYLRN